MNKNNSMSRFLTNNNRFKKDNPNYSRVYLLNAALIVLSIVCLFFAVLNFLENDIPTVVILDLFIMISSIITIVYFHKTDNIRITSILTTVLLSLLMAVYFYVIQNRNFGLFWFSIYPPFTYLIFGRKKGRIYTLTFGSIILTYVILCYKSWEPAVFDYQSLINIIAAAICLSLLIVFYENSRKAAEDAIILKNKELEIMSITDRLTGLYNRHKLDIALNDFLSKSDNCNNIFSIIIADIDYFKSFNDAYGHLYGDKVLVDLASIIKATAGDKNIVGRWGGEEFLIICPGLNNEGVKELALKMLDNISNYKTKDNKKVSMSFGIASCQADETIDTLLQRADASLYCSKDKGRNMVDGKPICDS